MSVAECKFRSEGCLGSAFHIKLEPLLLDVFTYSGRLD